MKKFASLVLAFSILTMTPWASALGETMVWGITSFPPGYITEGDDKGTGYADQLDQFMRDRLPQYDHEIVELPNWERQFRFMKKGPLVCTSILWYRPPEERTSIKGAYLLSAPNGVFFQHDVIVSKSKRHLYGEEVSFKDLLADPLKKFAYNRPYGITFNRIISDHVGIAPGVELDALPSHERPQYIQKADNVVVRLGKDAIGGTLKMILKDHIDYTLEYDFMVRYQQKKMGLSGELASIPVTEVKDKISRIAYACSDTPEGEKAIEAINKVLKENRNTEEFKKTLSLIVPKGREDIYWKAYDKILKIER